MTGVTAIMPVFNGARFLRDTVASVVAQTRRPDRLVIVDDGSTDGSRDVLATLDLPIETVVLDQPNRGQSAARNLAVTRATGDVLAFIDHDDVWHPRHVEVLVGLLDEAPDVGRAYSNLDEIGHDGRLVHVGFIRSLNPGAEHPKVSLYNMLGGDLFIFPSAAVVRRAAFDAVGGFDLRLAGYEDDDLFLRLFRAGWANRYTDQSLVRYRRHTASSVFSERQWRSRDVFAQTLLDQFPDDPDLCRFFVRDLIAPRFYRTGVGEYLRHLARGRWDLCHRSLGVMRRFAPLTRPGVGRRAKLAVMFALMRHPRLFRRLYTLVRTDVRFH